MVSPKGQVGSGGERGRARMEGLKTIEKRDQRRSETETERQRKKEVGIGSIWEKTMQNGKAKKFLHLM